MITISKFSHAQKSARQNSTPSWQKSQKNPLPKKRPPFPLPPPKDPNLLPYPRTPHTPTRASVRELLPVRNFIGGPWEQKHIKIQIQIQRHRDRDRNLRGLLFLGIFLFDIVFNSMDIFSQNFFWKKIKKDQFVWIFMLYSGFCWFYNLILYIFFCYLRFFLLFLFCFKPIRTLKARFIS